MRILLTSMLLFLAAATLSAQEEESGYPAPEAAALSFNDTMMVARLDRLTTKLQLTAEQRPVVAEMLREFAGSVAGGSPAEKRSLRQAFRSRIRGLLTPDQQARLREARGAGGQRRPTPAGKRNPAPDKKNWLDTLLDDIASPLLDRRRKGGNRHR